MMEKNILVIGLGSMGKRRVRNLKAIGIKNIVGFDKREDRRDEASTEYDIEVVANFEEVVLQHKFDAFIISVPPDLHHIYMKEAINMKIPAFIEASVIDTDFDLMIKESRESNVLLAPSCTLHFHPAIRKISEIIEKNELGIMSNILYHSGQYLPDWHSYEDVRDFYVSKKETGGGREIVPFELTWLTLLLGFPKRVVGFFKNTIQIPGAEEIDDTYNLLMDYGSMILNLSVDVVSRHATRRMVINGSKKQLYWNWDDNAIKIFDPELNEWDEIMYETVSAKEGYNKNITEQMYIDEMSVFINSINGNAIFPNNLHRDHQVLKLLYSVESSDVNNRIEIV